MRKWVVLSSLLCLGGTVQGLQIEPWLPQPYHPQLFGSYTYSNFSSVANATRQIHGRSHDQQLVAGLNFATMTYWGIDLEAEFARTPRFPWGLRSVGAQVRKQLFNDIAGDLATLTMGLSFRVVPPRPLEDVSTPYHYNFNGEINASLGKEWSYDIYWRCRIFNFLGFGIANSGSAWLRDYCALGLNREDQLQFQTFIFYYRGFGDQIGVNTSTSRFNGWKNIDHRSLDWGFSFRYIFRFYGSLTFEFKRRLYARSFPQRVNFFVLRYDLPLSL